MGVPRWLLVVGGGKSEVFGADGTPGEELGVEAISLWEDRLVVARGWIFWMVLRMWK